MIAVVAPLVSSGDLHVLPVVADKKTWLQASRTEHETELWQPATYTVELDSLFCLVDHTKHELESCLLALG